MTYWQLRVLFYNRLQFAVEIMVGLNALTGIKLDSNFWRQHMPSSMRRSRSYSQRCPAPAKAERERSVTKKVTVLVEKGNREDSSKLLLNLVMEKGSLARRVMWEAFVKMRHGLPKLEKILKEIQELGSEPFDYMIITRALSDVPKHLKDVQQKHKETLRVQTETLRVNTILIKEKVKIFQLVDRYAELTVISAVQDRTLVEHELLARGRDHEEWREKHLRKELEKIRTDQLFQSSFSLRKSKSGSSAAVSGVPGIGKTTMV
ncbi:uncharacterized protein [Heterodontus francisci]|uniref:uncharacterized protein isoform X1 n=1 Tax=Heterodontus francisci TaxID=7792 RepID=UPI00355B829F